MCTHFAKSFDELLEIGRKQLKGDIKDDLTGIDDRILSGKYLEQMIVLNEHMYTTYSTNPHDDTLSLQGILTLPIALMLRDKIKGKIWFTIYDDEGIIIDKDYDNRANTTFTLKQSVTKSNRIVTTDIDQSINGDSWIYYDPTEFINKLPSRYQTYFHGDWMINTDPKYATDDLCCDNGHYLEVHDYCDNSLFIGENRLVNMTFEDPIIGRKSLYEYLIKMFKEITDFIDDQIDEYMINK